MEYSYLKCMGTPPLPTSQVTMAGRHGAGNPPLGSHLTAALWMGSQKTPVQQCDNNVSVWHRFQTRLFLVVFMVAPVPFCLPFLQADNGTDLRKRKGIEEKDSRTWIQRNLVLSMKTRMRVQRLFYHAFCVECLLIIVLLLLFVETLSIATVYGLVVAFCTVVLIYIAVETRRESV